MIDVQEVVSVLHPSNTNDWPGLTRGIRETVNEFIDEQNSVRELAYLYANLRNYLKVKQSSRRVKKFTRKIMDKIFIKCVYESGSVAATSTFLRKI